MDSRLKHIGDFRTEFEAAIAYDEHAARLGKALNRPKPPTVCSQCGKAPPSVVQCLPPALPPPPVPKPFANSKSPSPPPESSSSSTSAVFRPVNVENGENKKDDNASKRPLQVTVAHACSNEGPTHSFPALPSSAKFFVLKSDRVKRLYRVIAREGTDAQVEAISGPASGGVFRRAATASAPQWVDMMDVLEFSPKASSSSVPKQSAAQHKPLPWPPSVDSKSAKAVLISRLREHDLDSRLAAAKPFMERMAPFSERELSIIKRGFLFGLVSGVSNANLFLKYFPNHQSAKKQGARPPANDPKLTADAVELEAIGEESTALMRAPLTEDDESAPSSAHPKPFDDMNFSPARGPSSFGFTPVAKKMRVGIEPEDYPADVSKGPADEDEVLQLDDGDLEGILFE